MLRTIRRLFALSGRRRPWIALGILYGLLNSAFQVLPVWALADLFSRIAAWRSGGEALGWTAAGFSFAVMAVSLAGKIAASYGMLLRLNGSSYGVFADQRIAMALKLKSLPLGFFATRDPGEIAATLTTTMQDVEFFGMRIVSQAVTGIAHAALIAVCLTMLEPAVGLIATAGLAGALLVNARIQKVGRTLAPRREEAQSDLAAAVLEYLRGMAVVKAFSMTAQAGKRIDRAFDESMRRNIELERGTVRLLSLFQLTLKAASCAILFAAPYLLVHGRIGLDRCVLFLVSSFMLFSSVETLGGTTMLARVIDAALDRIAAIADLPLQDEQPEAAEIGSFDIDLQKASFSYGNGEAAVQDIDLRIRERTMTAIVGPSGSGKTTLCSLIAGFWPTRSGSVKIGGIDVSRMGPDGALKHIAMVFQDTYLFRDSILNNIRYGNPSAGREEAMEAARRARCHDFIAALPDGYDTMVGEGGSSLSGGEKQRVSIARALLKNSPIIILDEATASLDPDNEYEVQEAIEALMEDRTILMIAHRLSTVEKADQIVVLDKGRIAQRGTHAQLAAQDGIYRNFVEIRRRAAGWTLA